MLTLMLGERAAAAGHVASDGGAVPGLQARDPVEERTRGGDTNPTPCLQSSAKMSGTVHGLARSAPRVRLSPGRSKLVGVDCGVNAATELHPPL
jgi:hypothetical protein